MFMWFWNRKAEQKGSRQRLSLIAFRLRRPLPNFSWILAKSSIFLVASDRDLSLTLSGVPALCVKAFAPHSSHTIFEVIIIKSQPQPERYSWATHYVIFPKTFTSTYGISLDRWWCASLYPKHLDPNRVQEYLKCFYELSIMKGLNEVDIRFKYSE